MGGNRHLLFALPVLTIGLLHTAIISGHASYAPAVIAIVPTTHLMLAWSQRASGRRKAVLAGVVAGLAVLQLVIVQGGSGFVDLVKIPPVLIHAWLAWLFGRTLLAGREPLIHRFSRLSRGAVPAELKSYTRWLTGLWAGMFAVMAVASAAFAVAAPSGLWSWVVNLGMPGFAAAVFLGDHAYRAVAYRHLGHNSPLGTLRTLLKAETWTAP